MNAVPLFTEHPITASDKTFFRLRGDIVEGAIAPASKLSETELSTKYQVSRALIREAINRLESCHLVERRANIGARVVSLSIERLLELYQVREALEGMAARLAAQHMSDVEIDGLNALLNAHYETLQDGDSYYQEAGDVDFHYRIVQGSKNQHLISVLIDSHYHLIRMYRVQLGMVGPRVSTAFEEHRRVAEAISNRDAELAEMLMRRHIQYTRNSLQARLLADNESTARK
jgi:DNA-binding GntR family transcriptional regulator